MGSVALARAAAPSLGASNTTPNSIQQIALRVPCYCGYSLQEGDSDKLGKWAGVVKGGAGDWVRQLQNDLIEFGVQKNGLIIEKKIPQPDKTVKNKKTGKSEKIKQPDQIEWQRAALTASGVFDEATSAALKLFQWHAKKVTLRQLGDNQVSVGITYSGNVDGVMSDEVCSEMKVWREKGYKLVKPALKEACIKVDADRFRQLYEANPRPNILIFEKLSNDKFLNLKGLLEKIRDDAEIKDIRWASYMFATILHECRSASNGWKCTWAPIAETPDKNGKYHGGAYGDPEDVVDKKGQHLDVTGKPTKDATKYIKRSYYGRGFVQLTHQENYRKFSDLLEMGSDLHVSPEKVLDSTVSYRIMSLGMREGKFRGGHKLSDYVSNESANYVSARAIINADQSRIEDSAPTLNGRKLSNGQIVGHYADVFEWIFYNSLVS